MTETCNIDDWKEICQQHEQIVADLRAENARLQELSDSLAQWIADIEPSYNRLAAENARLRAAIQAELQRWRREVSDFADAGFCDFNDVPMPAHLVALQDAIYREGEKP